MKANSALEQLSPCLSCGACCAFYHCSFYWRETDEGGGTVPAHLTEDSSAHRKAMRGTTGPKPRCIALTGEVGVFVSCAIYELRSSVCRAFDAAWEKGEPNMDCDRARLAHGLRPLTPEDWRTDTETPGAPPPAPGHPDRICPAA